MSRKNDDVSAYLDKTSVEFVDKEVFTDITAGVRHEADLVVKARFKGTDSCFLIHVETQAHPQSELAIATKDRAHVKLECLRLLATLKLNRAQQYMISGFVDTYLDLTTKELEIYRRDKKVLSEPEQELIMEIETSWKREGRLEGRLEEIVSVVCRLLQHRFGKVEDTVLERVRLLKYEQLKVLSEALLDFAAIADLHKWLEQHERRV